MNVFFYVCNSSQETYWHTHHWLQPKHHPHWPTARKKGKYKLHCQLEVHVYKYTDRERKNYNQKLCIAGTLNKSWQDKQHDICIISYLKFRCLRNVIVSVSVISRKTVGGSDWILDGLIGCDPQSQVKIIRHVAYLCVWIFQFCKHLIDNPTFKPFTLLKVSLNSDCYLHYIKLL